MSLILGELALAVASAAALIGAAVVARRWLLVVAGVLLGLRVAIIAVLWTAGWWFVQEKVLLTVPLAILGYAVALRWPSSRVAVLVAGYAAAIGPLVTLIGGYPLTWTSALLTVGALGLAAVLTARVVGLAQLRAPSVGAVTLLVLAVGLSLTGQSTVDLGGGPSVAAGPVIPVMSLTGPSTPAPGGVVRRYSLAARKATVTIEGRQVEAWTFNGTVPGPALTANQGDLLEVTLTNVDIDAGVTVHWHGYDVPNAADGAPGVTQDAVQPGQSYVYRFRADQVGTYWYHTHEVSAQGVKLGLYGTLVVRSIVVAGGVDLTLAAHTLSGTFTVGRPPAPVPAGTPVRARLVNTDDTPLEVALVGTEFRVVAVDGSDLHEPGVLREVGLRIPAGGRYDVAFTMPAGPVALRFPDHPSASVPFGGAVDDDPPAWPTLDLLSYGAPAPVPAEFSHVDRQFTLVLDRGLALVDGAPSYAYTVDGQAYPDIPVETVAYGDIVEFTIVNRSLVVHPWHLHGHHVLVLSRDGEAARGSPLWMDTFDVRPGEVWRVAFRADNPGLWLNHCHNLPHAENGMALHLAYAGVVSPFHGGHGG